MMVQFSDSHTSKKQHNKTIYTHILKKKNKNKKLKIENKNSNE
jgi:hypothetical protein